MWVSLGGWSETHVCPIDKIIMALSLYTCVKLGFHQRCKHIVAQRRRKRVLISGQGGVLSSISSTKKYRCVQNRVYNFES